MQCALKLNLFLDERRRESYLIGRDFIFQFKSTLRCERWVSFVFLRCCITHFVRLVVRPSGPTKICMLFIESPALYFKCAFGVHRSFNPLILKCEINAWNSLTLHNCSLRSTFLRPIRIPLKIKNLMKQWGKADKRASPSSSTVLILPNDHGNFYLNSRPNFEKGLCYATIWILMYKMGQT